MKKRLLFIALAAISACQIKAQNYASASLTTQPATDRQVPFALQDEGEYLPIEWGLDTAWPDEANIKRGVAFLGKDLIDVVRVSFQPTWPLTDGELHQYQKDSIDLRLQLVDLTGDDTKLTLNCDHPRVDSWFVGNAERWAQLIDLTAQRYQAAGREIVSVAPFNEPDYTYTGQGTMQDFYNIAAELRKNPRFDNIRICGGNTLNCDQALIWYNFLKEYLDEGNTHQLAGTFDNYANFFETVRSNGHHATADELHNVMEAIVGVEYGMQTGIWWGTTDYARAEFVKASDGQRLAYSEHRPNWTAAAVYKSPDGKVQAFAGSSERQAVTTSYRFISKTGDVFFNGYGPQREFVVELPGGAPGSYQEGQTSAECVVNITTGEDVERPINGEYLLFNKGTGKVMMIEDDIMSTGKNIITDSRLLSKKTQVWNVTPVASTIGGDFSYFSITPASNSGLSLDILNWSLEDGGSIILYNNAKGHNQQWFLEYAGDGWYYIRSRYSALCLESYGGKVQQKTKDGTDKQLWRLLDSSIRRISRTDSIAPNAPADLKAEEHAATIVLNWTAPDEDLTYIVLRGEQTGGPYTLIGRGFSETSFTDNKAEAGKTYYYVVKAQNECQYTSVVSNEVSASTSDEDTAVLYYAFDEDLNDSTGNMRHAVAPYTLTWDEGKFGESLVLDGKNHVQLPSVLGIGNELTISTWMYCTNISNTWQRLFDFGYDEEHYMFLTPRSDNRTLRFAIRNGGEEQFIESELPATTLLRKWLHVAVTMEGSAVKLYLNGEEVASTSDIGVEFSDLQPFVNYIGRSQFASDPLFEGMIDDFIIYNHALSSEEIKTIANGNSVNIEEVTNEAASLYIFPLPANDILTVKWGEQNSFISIFNMQGNRVLSSIMQNGSTDINVSSWPEGVYVLKATSEGRNAQRKFTVKH